MNAEEITEYVMTEQIISPVKNQMNYKFHPNVQ